MKCLPKSEPSSKRSLIYKTSLQTSACFPLAYQDRRFGESYSNCLAEKLSCGGITVYVMSSIWSDNLSQMRNNALGSWLANLSELRRSPGYFRVRLFEANLRANRSSFVSLEN